MSDPPLSSGHIPGWARLAAGVVRRRLAGAPVAGRAGRPGGQRRRADDLPGGAGPAGGCRARSTPRSRRVRADADRHGRRPPATNGCRRRCTARRRGAWRLTPSKAPGVVSRPRSPERARSRPVVRGTVPAPAARRTPTGAWRGPGGGAGRRFEEVGVVAVDLVPAGRDLLDGDGGELSLRRRRVDPGDVVGAADQAGRGGAVGSPGCSRSAGSSACWPSSGARRAGRRGERAGAGRRRGVPPHARGAPGGGRRRGRCLPGPGQAGDRAAQPRGGHAAVGDPGDRAAPLPDRARVPGHRRPGPRPRRAGCRPSGSWASEWLGATATSAAGGGSAASATGWPGGCLGVHSARPSVPGPGGPRAAASWDCASRLALSIWSAMIRRWSADEPEQQVVGLGRPTHSRCWSWPSWSMGVACSSRPRLP